MKNSTRYKMKMFRHQIRLCLAPVIFSFVFIAAPLRAADDTMVQPSQPVQLTGLHYLTGKKPDAIALLAPPPLPDSPEQAADMAEVQAVYHAATSNDIAAAYSEKKFNIFKFTPAIGAFFQSNNLPKTTAFFERVLTDAKTVTDNAKDYYNRPRPYVIDPSLGHAQPEKHTSYPSGHACETMVLALVLADLFPDKHDAIVAISRNIGWHRVEIGDHYPTDIYAGRVLAQAIVKQMVKSDAFQHDIAEAKAEIATAQTAASH